MARRRGHPAGEGQSTRRHRTQSRVLVLGAQQSSASGSRPDRPRRGLSAVRRPTVSTNDVRRHQADTRRTTGGVRRISRHLRKCLPRSRIAQLTRRTTLPPRPRRVRLLVGNRREQDPARSSTHPRRCERVDGRRRCTQHREHDRVRSARRSRHPARIPSPTHHHRGRKSCRSPGDICCRRDDFGAGSQSRHLRDRRIHPRRRATPQLLVGAALSRVRGDHQRGRFRENRRIRRSADTKHELRVDVSDLAGTRGEHPLIAHRKLLRRR